MSGLAKAPTLSDKLKIITTFLLGPIAELVLVIGAGLLSLAGDLKGAAIVLLFLLASLAYDVRKELRRLNKTVESDA